MCLADAVADAHAAGATDAATRRMHVGYYLVDQGLPTLKALVGYRAPFLHRIADAVTSAPTGFYLGGVALVTLAIVVSVLDLIDAPAAIWVAFLLLLLPTMQAAVEFVNALVPAVDAAPRRAETRLLEGRPGRLRDDGRGARAAAERAARARVGDGPGDSVPRQS